VQEQLPEWVPEGVDITVPNAARVYDAALGGYHNFAVDREFRDQAELAWPGITLLAHANRAYLGRVVRWLVDAGMRQFLDIGSGIPTLGNVHEVAQRIAPEARVMYVDIDPVAVSHAQAILLDNPLAAATRGDLRFPQAILSDPDVIGLIDFAEPVAVLLNAVLHFIPDSDDPPGILRQLNEAVVAGSYIAVSHGTHRPDHSGEQDSVNKLYDRTPTAVTVRSPEEVAVLLTGLDLVPPGIVAVTDWHPDPEDDDPPEPSVLGAVGRKP
jgi:hypothetical protein